MAGFFGFRVYFSNFGSKSDPPPPFFFFIRYLNSPWKPGSNEWSFAGVKCILRKVMASGKVEKMSFGTGGHFATPTATHKACHPTHPNPSQLLQTFIGCCCCCCRCAVVVGCGCGQLLVVAVGVLVVVAAAAVGC